MKMRILIYALAGIIVLSLATISYLYFANRGDSDVAKALVSEGHALYEKKEYTKSIAKFSEALEEQPSNAEAYLGITTILLEKGYMQEAEEVAQEAALRLDNTDVARIFVNIGDKYFMLEEHQNAQEMYELSFEKDKSDLQVGLSLARFWIDREDIDKAIKHLDSVSSRDKSNYEYLVLRSYLSLDDFSKGSSFINDVDLNDISNESDKERVRRLREIYSLDADSLHKVTYLAGEYINAKYPYLAIEIIEKQEENIEEYWDGQYFLGKAYLDHGDYSKAVEKLSNAVALEVEDVDLYMNLARAHLLSDNLDRALQNYRLAASNTNLLEEYYVVQEYVSVLLENNMLSSARTSLLELLEDNNNPWIYLLLCEVTYIQKNLAEMYKYIGELQASSSLTPAEERELLKYRILHALEDIKNENELSELIRLYQNIEEYNAEAFLFEGQFLAYQEDIGPAEVALHRAIELDLEGEITQRARRILATIE